MDWAEDAVEALARAFQSPAALLGTMAVAFVIVSAFLVQRALRFNRNNAAARFALITPWTHASSAAPARAAETMEEALRGTELSRAEREISRRLMRFGIPVRFAPAFLLAARVWFALCFGAGSWFLAPHVIAAGPSLRAALVGVIGWFGWVLPALAAEWAAKTRAATVVAGLPDALELLVICAEGGLALGDGIDRIVVGLRRSQPELAEELAMTAADLKILPSQDTGTREARRAHRCAHCAIGCNHAVAIDALRNAVRPGDAYGSEPNPHRCSDPPGRAGQQIARPSHGADDPVHHAHDLSRDPGTGDLASCRRATPLGSVPN